MSKQLKPAKPLVAKTKARTPARTPTRARYWPGHDAVEAELQRLEDILKQGFENTDSAGHMQYLIRMRVMPLLRQILAARAKGKHFVFSSRPDSEDEPATHLCSCGLVIIAAEHPLIRGANDPAPPVVGDTWAEQQDNERGAKELAVLLLMLVPGHIDWRMRELERAQG